MTELFLTVVQMSITSSIIILTVLLIRLLLKKAPRKYSYLLWAVVAFRLVWLAGAIVCSANPIPRRFLPDWGLSLSKSEMGESSVGR